MMNSTLAAPTPTPVPATPTTTPTPETPDTAGARLAWLKQHLGGLCEPISVDRDRPLLLVDWRHAYLTLADRHELYSVDFREGRPVGACQPVAHCRAGQVLFGVPPTPGARPRALLLSGAPESAVWRVPLCYLALLARESPECLAQVGALIDSWIQLLIDSLPKAPVPAQALTLMPGDPLRPGIAPVRAADGLCWIVPSTAPTSYRGLTVGSLEVPAPWWAISRDTAAICSGSGLRVSSTATLLAADPSASLIRGFVAFVVAAVSRRPGERHPERVDVRSTATTRSDITVVAGPPLKRPSRPRPVVVD